LNKRPGFLPTLFCAWRWFLILLLSSFLGGTVRAQIPATPAVSTSSTYMAPVASESSPSVLSGAGSVQANPLMGSVPQGQAQPGSIDITALEAIQRGLKYNLGLILSGQSAEAARAARLRALSDAIPYLTSHVGESVQQINLAAYGIPAPPGTPPVIGPFSVFDVRAFTAWNFDLKVLNTLYARAKDLAAAESNYQNTRDLIVLVVGGTYLQALSAQARIAAIQAQFNTAESLYQQARDMKNAGMAPGIDVLRAQVEMQVQQQRLLVARNDLAKQKLTLARIIGLPTAQEFNLVDNIPFTPAPPITLDIALQRAFRDRADYKGALQLLQSAELQRKASVGERLPGLQINADYGVLGKAPGDSHGTFTTAAYLRIPIFQGGRAKSDIQESDILIQRRKAEADDLRGRIEFDIRTAFLDLSSATDQVQVARSSVDLAQQTLGEARDRFTAGVTNNIEVVQAQEAAANTNENYISSMFAYNVAKLELARSLGVAENAVVQFLGGKP